MVASFQKFSNAFSKMQMYEYRLKFHWRLFLINSNPALVHIIAWHRAGAKPLSEPMMVNLLTHICVIRPQWVNSSSPWQNGHYFAIDILRCIFVKEKYCILIKNSLKFVPKGQIYNNIVLVKIMPWRRKSDKPLSKPNFDPIHWRIYAALGRGELKFNCLHKTVLTAHYSIAKANKLKRSVINIFIQFLETGTNLISHMAYQSQLTGRF